LFQATAVNHLISRCKQKNNIMEQLLSNISWAQFLATVLLTLAIYYSYLAYHYYPQEIRSLFQKKYQPGHNPFRFQQDQLETDAPQTSSTTGKATAQEFPFEETTDNTFDRIEEMVEKIKPVLAGFDQAETGTLLAALKPILSEFPELKYSAFSPAIIELIQTEIKNTGSVAPSEEQIRGQWG
jgi:hypothetical protein